MARIQLDGVTVDFPVYDGAARSFRHSLARLAVGGAIARQRRGVVEVRALDGIDLRLEDGDRLGLIGGNGAGKTTLIRVLAGLREPTAGRAVIEGSTAALLSLGAILDGEMTGYENIDRARVLLGLPSRAALVAEIADFTELGPFLDLPVKTYSAGMQLRLSFALMTAQHPEILLLDEVFSAGDSGFRIRAEQRMRELHARTAITVFANHGMSEILSHCTKALWLDHGRIRALGPAAEVVAAYEAATAA
ncbi:ABC transporter ATP-binding protein [Phaeospirillum tilakii]|uniref:ABC transporter ATP-binding protein n=1 Tax=Phaeospirillum tilakii TaxID=741673 RepID=A0ABW5C8S6_9PROT